MMTVKHLHLKQKPNKILNELPCTLSSRYNPPTNEKKKYSLDKLQSFTEGSQM